jgi:hypothetical protein
MGKAGGEWSVGNVTDGGYDGAELLSLIGSLLLSVDRAHAARVQLPGSMKVIVAKAIVRTREVARLPTGHLAGDSVGR